MSKILLNENTGDYLIDLEVQKAARILKDEGELVELLKKDKVQFLQIPDGYFNQAKDFLLQEIGLENSLFYVMDKEQFHKFYNWLREVGRSVPEL
jgi:hypothetical protein